MQLKQPTTQLTHVLYKLIEAKGNRWESDTAITMKDFEGYPRLSEYIRLLRQKEKLEIKTIPIKFTTKFGYKSEYASYKLLSETKFAEEIYLKLISK